MMKWKGKTRQDVTPNLSNLNYVLQTDIDTKTMNKTMLSIEEIINV
jgi:hypothetical protein